MTMTAIEQLQQCEAEMGKSAFLEMMLPWLASRTAPP
jgi:hypothetical protein